ncbi:MAG TPA: selenide, water dikinase SelD [bacterium]|nr:selenide, water dikinase SelD [bacterium]
MDREDLAQVLRRLPHLDNPNILQGYLTADDAGVYRLDDSTALVQTVDFFPPVVDDPYYYGAVAAANSLSDVYAMGARPVVAMNVLGFPRKKLDNLTVEKILLGAVEKSREADCPIVGGHTIDAPEPFFGLSVTGLVNPAKFIGNNGGKAGNLLVLTKPIGTGALTTAAKAELIGEELLRETIRTMATLNKQASKAMASAGASACTDVTGFGLLGHLHEMCSASGVGARINAFSVPLIDPAVIEFISQGITTKLTNFEGSKKYAVYEDGVDENMRIALCDPQTSGGLLIALPPDALGVFEAEMAGYDLRTAVIGSLIESGEAAIKVGKSD